MRAVCLLALVLAVGCGSSANDALKDDFQRGVAQINALPNAHDLKPRLSRTLAQIRGDEASTASARRGKSLAVAGFSSTLNGLQTQIDMQENDSGKLEAAVRDAKRADRYLYRGADQLRAAGRALGLEIGKINGR